MSLQNKQKGTVVVRISQRHNGASWGNQVLTVVPGTNRALSVDELLLSRRITMGARPVVLSGREPDKNVPPLGYLLWMSHDHAFTLSLLMLSFYWGFNDSLLLKGNTFGDSARTTASCHALCSYGSARKACGGLALAHITSLLAPQAAGALSAPVTVPSSLFFWQPNPLPFCHRDFAWYSLHLVNFCPPQSLQDTVPGT